MYQEVSENFKRRATHHQRNTVFIMLKMMLEW